MRYSGLQIYVCLLIVPAFLGHAIQIVPDDIDKGISRFRKRDLTPHAYPLFSDSTKLNSHNEESAIHRTNEANKDATRVNSPELTNLKDYERSTGTVSMLNSPFVICQYCCSSVVHSSFHR